MIEKRREFPPYWLRLTQPEGRSLWIFFAVALGIVLVWAYTVSYCRQLGGSRRLTGSPGYLFDNLSWMVLYTYLW